MKNPLLIALMLPFLINCAHVSQKDCLEKDWQELGFLDGSQGNSQADMTKIADSCSRFSMANPPENQYKTGYNLGLKSFCTHDRGFSLGRLGMSYPAVCDNPSVNYKELSAGWEQGLDTFCVFESGEHDGASGRNPNGFCDTRSREKYFAGHKKGAQRYCARPETAFELGKNGKSDFIHCPSNLKGAFDRAYAQGNEIYSEIARLQRQIKDATSRLSSQEKKERNAKYSIQDHESKIRRLEYDIGNAETQIQKAESALRACDRKNELCDEHYIEGLEKSIRQYQIEKTDCRAKKSDLSLKLPHLFSERNAASQVIPNLKREIDQLHGALSKAKAKGFNL